MLALDCCTPTLLSDSVGVTNCCDSWATIGCCDCRAFFFWPVFFVVRLPLFATPPKTAALAADARFYPPPRARFFDFLPFLDGGSATNVGWTKTPVILFHLHHYEAGMNIIAPY